MPWPSVQANVNDRLNSRPHLSREPGSRSDITSGRRANSYVPPSEHRPCWRDLAVLDDEGLVAAGDQREFEEVLLAEAIALIRDEVKLEKTNIAARCIWVEPLPGAPAGIVRQVVGSLILCGSEAWTRPISRATDLPRLRDL